MVELDRVDRLILKFLQEDNQISNLALADKVNLSPPTCLRRVRRLREEKVIVGDVALLDPLMVDKKLFVFIEVKLERQTDLLQKKFEKKMQQAPEVMQCYMVSGEADFILVTLVSDMLAYHRFIRHSLMDDSNIRNFRSVFALNRVKFRTDINLDSADP